jgi:glutathione S-transferase
MAILLAQQPVMLRDVVLKNKPPQLLQVSAKASVPVLVLPDRVIEQSLEIMTWALTNNDPTDLLGATEPNTQQAIQRLIKTNDEVFTHWLTKYQHAKRHHSNAQIFYRRQCELFIIELEQYLSQHQFLLRDQPTIADYAIAPFVRQFSRVDRPWYRQAPYPHLRRWLSAHIDTKLFNQAMVKYPQWLDNQQELLFGDGKN